VECDEFLVTISLYLFHLNLELNYWQQLYERELKFTLKKSLKFLLKILTLVSSANNIVSDAEFILRRK
jgi:hypothetical protein